MRKVAIYVRVSTEHEAQLAALENQVQYYDNLLKQHKDWELYDRYIDEGITGTSTKKRKNFMRMIEDAKDGCFDLYLDGIGTRQIQYELEKRGRKTATGLTKWSAPTISRILRNPFYSGVIVYRKQYVPDYLEQKKINNHGDVEKIVVEGTHEPIISKEDFEKVGKKLDSRSVQATKNARRSIYPPQDIWNKKLECSCGDHFNRKVWSKDKEGNRKFSYQCHSQVVTGTVKSRQRRGLSIEGICAQPMIQEWKLRLMAQVIFDTLWQDKHVVIEIANSLLEQAVNEAIVVDHTEEVFSINKKMLQIQNKVERLIQMRLDGELSPEEYKKIRKDLDAQMDKLETRLKSINSEEETGEDDVSKKVKGLQDALETRFDFKRYEIPDSVIDAFVDKIKVQDD